ncbi:MAG: alpha/beta hydrolase [Deltaproteobacteria bacterium]|nr:MAG: alpha/beta hydrolase [Deltaproteobacteria bacterium]
MGNPVIYDIQDPLLSGKLTPKIAQTTLGVVEYAEIGEGPAVVALHGAMGGYDQSLILAQTIGNGDFHYLAMTRPGYLGTPLSSGRSPEQQGDLVAALLDKFGITKAGVMAVSGGGPSAVQFALRHPGRCAGLVLVSTLAEKLDTPIPFSFKIMKFLARWPWFANRFRKKAARDLEAMAKRSIRDPEILQRTINDAETWPLFSTMLLSTFDRLWLRLDGTENDIEISRTAAFPLEDLQPPVLIVHGTQDQLVPFAANAKGFESRVPNAELLAVEGGEHVAIFTHRSEVKPKVIEFMQRHFTAL